MSSLGGSRADLCAAMPAMLTRALSDDALARDLAWDLAQYFAQYLAHGGLGEARWGAQDVAQDLARDFAQDLARGFARNFARHWARHWAQFLAQHFARDFAQYFARRWARHWARHWAWDFTRGFAQYFAWDLARRWALPWEALWVDDAAAYEYLSAMGQSSTRAAVAHAPSEGEPLLALLSPACRASLWQTPDSAELTAALAAHAGTLDPLWPALARHIARCATDEDRDLLEHLARHPDEREPPLSWGLQ